MLIDKHSVNIKAILKQSIHTVNKTIIRTYPFLIKRIKNTILIIASLFFCLSLNAQDSSKFVTYYYENGVKSSEGFLRDGQPDGYWKSFYLNGLLKTEGNRKEFKLDGTWKFYSEFGDLALSIDYIEGMKEGHRKTYLDNIVQKDEKFSNDKREGLTVLYDEKGRRMEEIPFVQDLQQGQGFGFDSLGLIINLNIYKSGVLVKKQPINRTNRLGLKVGTWIDFYDNRNTRIEGTYRNDLKHGYFKYYTKGGSLIRTEHWIDGVLQEPSIETAKIDIRKEISPETGQLVFKGSYVNGKENGVHRFYDDEGNIISSKVYTSGILMEEGGTVDELGRKQGRWKAFYADGTLRHEGAYKDGLRTGPWIYYFNDQSIEQKGSYVEDEPNGEWVWFYPNGDIWREESYLNGLEDGLSIEYDTEGIVLAKGEFIDGFREGEWVFISGDHREEGTFFEGERIGVWKHYYLKPEESLRFEGEYDNGRESGKHIVYYPNGGVKIRGNYNSGIKTGIWELFKEDSTRYLTIEYDSEGQEIKYNGVKIQYGRRFRE